MSLKDLISSPLEAGTSILDAQHLPPHLVPALEYVSDRLARKAMHITLVVVRRDYQLPHAGPALGSLGPAIPPTPTSPRFGLGFGASPVAALKQLVRSSSKSSSSSLNIDAQRAAAATPMTPSAGAGTPGSRQPMSPRSPMLPLSPPPMTPSCTTASTITDSTTGPVPANSCAFRLVYPAGLPAKDEKILRHALQRAEQKFDVGSEWLSPAMSPAACGLTNQIILASVVQNEVLFASEGITILTLDRLYSLKAALSAYTKTGSPLRLEDAVDELRRLVLAGNGCKVSKADLFRSYDWMNVSRSSVTALDRMYKRAYGGPEEIGAISGMQPEPVKQEQAPEAIILTSDEAAEEQAADICTIGIALTTEEPTKRASPKAPVLKLQTSFAPPPKQQQQSVFDDDDDDDRTPRATDCLPIMLQPFNSLSIDEVVSAGVLSPMSAAPLGPRTPNGYDDISPTTRGEWGFLMVDDAFSGAKRGAVEAFCP